MLPLFGSATCSSAKSKSRYIIDTIPPVWARLDPWPEGHPLNGWARFATSRAAATGGKKSSAMIRTGGCPSPRCPGCARKRIGRCTILAHGKSILSGRRHAPAGRPGEGETGGEVPGGTDHEAKMACGPAADGDGARVSNLLSAQRRGEAVSICRIARFDGIDIRSQSRSI